MNLDQKCTEKQIEDSYCQLAMKYHPDKNKGDERMTRKFQEITEAYETLKDTARRKRYDNGLLFNGIGTSTTIRNTRMVKLTPSMLNNLIERYKQEDNSIKVSIVMTLEDIMKGSNRLENVMIEGRTHLVNVMVEPGCTEGQEIRVNKGNIPIIFKVTEKKHDIFTRKGHDLYINKTLSLREYINGFEFIVELLDGRKKKIKHSYGGTILEQLKPLKMQGCGMPIGHSGRSGDLYVNIAIQLPRTLKQ